MPAPAPYDGVAGRVSLGQIAQNVVANYKWLYRWSDEIKSDALLDKKKAAQLAVQHCRMFREAIQSFLPVNASSPVLDALEAEFAWHGMKWATRAGMVQDIQAIYQKCGQVYDRAKIDKGVLSFSERTFDETGREIEVPAITDGSVTANGTASHWGLSKTTATTALLAAQSLTSSQSVTNGNTFSLDAIIIAIPDPTA